MSSNKLQNSRKIMHQLGGACWAIPLSLLTSCWRDISLHNILPDYRIQRAESFHNTDDQIRTAGAELWLRLMLAMITGQSPGELSISFGKFKKPRLTNLPNSLPLYFNIAHSGNWILIAIATDSDIGVDVEVTSRMSVDLKDTILSDDERSTLMLPQGNSRLIKQQLTRYWVGKEAYTKLLGRGITMPIQEITIDAENEVSRVFFQSKPAGCWLAIGNLDREHQWALATHHQSLTSQVFNQLILVDKPLFNEAFQSFGGPYSLRKSAGT